MLAVMHSDLPATQRYVALLLADRAHADGTSIRPGTAWVARHTGLDESTVTRSVRWMIGERILIKVRDATARRPAEYRLNLPGLEDRGAQGTPSPGPETHDRGAESTPGGAQRTRNPPEPSSTDTSSPKKVRSGKPPAKVPDAVAVMRQATGRYPARSWYEVIQEAVGSTPEALERWGALCTDWVGRGWNPTNVKGMLEAFSTGVPLTDRRPAPKMSKADRDAKMLAEQERYRRARKGENGHGSV